jgi:uncharacterized membrane protein YbhN (UPF0104 family)
LNYIKKVAENETVKRYLSWAGMGLGVLGIVFIVIKLAQYNGQIDYSRLTLFDWLAFGGLALLYGVASWMLLPWAWNNLLKHYGISISLLWAIRTYGLSQLAKYVPGNIFHLASRQAIGVAAGLPGWPLAKSTFWDLVLEAISGIFFGILVLPSFFPGITTLETLIIFVVAFLIYFLAVSHWWSRWVAYAAGAYTLFLSFAGIIFVLVLSLWSGTENLPIVSICGAYVVAWLIGLITPGAPAGAGVRELVLYALLRTSIPQTDLLYVIVIGRIVTILGDVVFYGMSLVMSKIWPIEKFQVEY